MTFAELVRNLGSVGVERLHVDLVRGDTTYYQGDYTAVLPVYVQIRKPAPRFSTAGIEAAGDACTYPEFCERILAAGCVGFIVSIVGRRVLYYGADGAVVSSERLAGRAITS
ncbi:hypothetical protein GOFOIKOB_4041 [Methylobacterium tardum]|nr:hypothetical protein GOFOIKOB_4041 [Methylobacterium tardum]